MVSRAQRGFNFVARYMQKPALSLIRPQWLLRRCVDLGIRLTKRPPRGLRERAEMLAAEGGQVPATWLDGGGETGRGVILYVHGGGFVIGSLRGYRHVVGQLAVRTGLPVAFVEYRLAPEHPFPAAPDDVLTAYRALIARGFDPRRIAVVGDSAGGCLTLALLHRIGALGLPMPGAAAVISPVTDLTGGSASLAENAGSERLIPIGWARRSRAQYLGDADPHDPLASPLFGRFEGAPPVMIQVCEDEALRDDSRRMAEALRAQGVCVRLDEWQGVYHVWHMNAGLSPEADRGIAEIADFLRETLKV